MPDPFESDTRKQLRRDYPGINWDEDEARPAAPSVVPPIKKPAGSNYGSMMRLLTSKGDFESELDKFTDLSTDETRRKGRERAQGYRGKMMEITGGE